MIRIPGRRSGIISTRRTISTDTINESIVADLALKPGEPKRKVLLHADRNGHHYVLIHEKFPIWCGTFVTAGDVAFYKTMDCWFKAVHARTGEVLWKFKVDSRIASQPITYLGPDGKQYVAVLTGVGGWPGSVVSKDPRPDKDPTAAHGFGEAMKELPKFTAKGGTLFVFSLP